MKLDLKNIRELAENIDKYNLNEVVVESDGVKVSLKREKKMPNVAISNERLMANKMAAESNMQEELYFEEKNDEKEEKEKYETIDAPMVGTFYRAPSPGSAPFIEEGQTVEAGSVVCILEAMKLMNEVKSNKKCTIVKMLVEDGQVVRKGDKLFSIK